MENGSLLDSNKLSSLLGFQVERKMVYLTKGFLETLEAYLNNHFITEEDFASARKKALDRLGESKRELEETFKKFRIELS